MVNSYDDMQGSASDPSDMPVNTVPQATQHYAGDVVPMGVTPSNTDQAASSRIEAHSYALGTEKSPKVLSIGKPTLKNWADRMSK